jgi:hypothetical protein
MIFKTKEKPLKCFYEESRARKYRDWVDRGIQTVEIDKIGGSVGRCLDFDTSFSIKNKGNKQHILTRAEKIKQVFLRKDKPLPPIELYKMDDEYYVLDGHHRIIAAKEQGQKFIDAHVVEYLPLDDTTKRSLIEKRIEFEDKTGVKEINLSRQGDYDKLLLQMKSRKNRREQKIKEELSFKEVASDWFYSLYFPVTEKIKNITLKEYFPDATIGDIYVYLCDQVNLLNRKDGHYEVNLEEALEELGILAKATKATFSGEGVKEKILKVFRPCFYLGKCRYER